MNSLDTDVKDKNSEMTEAVLRSHLSLICDWLRMRMRGHIDPLSTETFVIQSERDVRDMIEAYLGRLVHFLFRLSTPPIPPHNTVVVDRRASIKRGEVLLKRFGLEDPSAFAPERVATSLRQVRDQFLFWLTGTHEVPSAHDRQVWMACHLWLERRFATGFRLLFFDGQNWQPTDGALSAAQVVYGWPNTLSRLVFQYYPTSEDPFLNGRSPASFYTAICAFDNEQEKQDFERASGLTDDQYIYLWTGTAPGERCDFNDELLVWFKNAGLLTDNQRLPDQPSRFLGNSIEKQRRWELLRQEIISPNDDDLEDYFLNNVKTDFKALVAQYSHELSKSSLAFKRCEATLKKILRKNDFSSDDCFWSLQSVMFYDWKYYYLFPFSYERQQFAGVALSTATPILQSHLRMIALFTSKMLEVFAETEDWARTRLLDRRASNLLQASEKVGDAWATREPTENILGSHKPFFQKLLKIVFEGENTRHVDLDPSLINSPPEKRERGRKDERANILYAAVNYWSSLLPDRVFAEWLTNDLGKKRQERWDQAWDVYKSITTIARNQFQTYTFNDFLFERAPRKPTIEWRWHERQVIPRSHENPSSWVSEPPSLTRNVERILFADIDFDPKEVEVSVRKCIDQFRLNISSIGSFCRNEILSYKNELKHFAKGSLGVFDDDLACLQQTLDALESEVSGHGAPVGKKRLARSQAAEYLVRLALYLNVQMHTTKGTEANTNMLGLSRCAFMSWALTEYYRPDTLGSELTTKVPAGDEVYSHFYSIPVHVSAANDAGISRSSILSLGTLQSLTPDELILLRDIGKEIVLPAMMLDLKAAVKQNEQKIAAQEKTQEVIAAQREMARRQVPAALHSARRLVGATTEKISHLAHWIQNDAEFDRYDAETLRGSVVEEVQAIHRYARETEGRISLLNSIAKHFHESRIPPNKPGPLGFKVYSRTGRQTIREIILHAIALPLNLNHIELATLDDVAASECLGAHTGADWILDLSGVQYLYERQTAQKRMANQVDCWRILFEEWADNIRGDWVEGSKKPRVELIVRSDTDRSVDVAVSNGPIPPWLNRTTGIGTMEIEWCVYGLSGHDFSKSEDERFFQGPTQDRLTNETIWSMRFKVPITAIEQGLAS